MFGIMHNMLRTGIDTLGDQIHHCRVGIAVSQSSLANINDIVAFISPTR
jgi:hypothetical protein